MNITTTKIVVGAILVIVGMAVAGYAFVDVLTGGSSLTNSTSIVVACLAGLVIYHRKLSLHE